MSPCKPGLNATAIYRGRDMKHTGSGQPYGMDFDAMPDVFHYFLRIDKTTFYGRIIKARYKDITAPQWKLFGRVRR